MNRPPEFDNMLKQSDSDAPNYKIGLIIGAGTGPILAKIFSDFINLIFEKSESNLEILSDPKVGSQDWYHTFKSIELYAKESQQSIGKISIQEQIDLLSSTMNWYRDGCRFIFRTAINAESLYLFRQKVKAVKEFGLNTPDGKQVLFVRDQAEGFYANTTYNITDEQIDFSGIFTREHQKKLVKFGIKRAYEKFGDSNFEKVVICKHHLFGNVLESWYKEAAIEENVFDLQVFQPDTGLTLLNNYFYPTDEKSVNRQLLVICSNEVGDIIYEALMKMIDPSAKLYLYSKNIYLAKPFEGNLIEYQTVHGSADDLMDPNKPEKINELIPYATLSIAIDMAATMLNSSFLTNELDEIIIQSRRARLNLSLDELIALIFEKFKNLDYAKIKRYHRPA